MTKREQFIKREAKKLYEEWCVNANPYVSVLVYIEDAIKLGMENADIKEDEYRIENIDSSRYLIYKNNEYIISIWYGFDEELTEERAYKAAQTLIEVLKNEC